MPKKKKCNISGQQNRKQTQTSTTTQQIPSLTITPNTQQCTVPHDNNTSSQSQITTQNTQSSTLFYTTSSLSKQILKNPTLSTTKKRKILSTQRKRKQYQQQYYTSKKLKLSATSSKVSETHTYHISSPESKSSTTESHFSDETSHFKTDTSSTSKQIKTTKKKTLGSSSESLQEYDSNTQTHTRNPHQKYTRIKHGCLPHTSSSSENDDQPFPSSTSNIYQKDEIDVSSKSNKGISESDSSEEISQFNKQFNLIVQAEKQKQEYIQLESPKINENLENETNQQISTLSPMEIIYTDSNTSNSSSSTKKKQKSNQKKSYTCSNSKQIKKRQKTVRKTLNFSSDSSEEHKSNTETCTKKNT